MATALTSLPNEILRDTRQSCREVLQSLCSSLDERPDMQNALRRLVRSDEIHETFRELAATSPDVARLLLQAAVAALVNVHRFEAIDSELKRRAVTDN